MTVLSVVLATSLLAQVAGMPGPTLDVWRPPFTLVGNGNGNGSDGDNGDDGSDGGSDDGDGGSGDGDDGDDH
jgi:hypothetical protein